MKKTLLTLALLLVLQGLRAQVIIPLLFGDKLNENENIDFGIQGGLNWSTLGGLDQAQYYQAFNLGIYFDIRMPNIPSLYLNIGALPLSTMGAGGVEVYSTGDPKLDITLAGGSVRRELDYINLPAGVKYMVVGNVFVESGLQLGLLLSATDVFTSNGVSGGVLEFRKNVTNNYKRMDVGVYAGVGYKIPWRHGVNLSARYYYGLLDIANASEMVSMYNRGIYLMASFPIGAH